MPRLRTPRSARTVVCLLLFGALQGWMGPGPPGAGELRAAELFPASGVRSAESRAAAALREGRLEDASALLDSLLLGDPSDLTAGYLAARADELRDRDERARCRYLELEGKAPETDEAWLASIRRRALETQRSDRMAREPEQAIERSRAGGVLVLPPDDLGDEVVHPYFGLGWAYLLEGAMRGSGLCAVSMPVLLVAVEHAVTGLPARAPADLVRRPVNTIGGLRARLAVLPASDGDPYVSESEGGWDEELRTAVERFQADRELPITGEADPATQRELVRALDRWLRRPPSTLPPQQLEEVMRRVGATLAIRGTYRFEGERVVCTLTALDVSGAPVLAAPLTLSFPAREAPRHARAAAAELIRQIGGEPVDPEGLDALRPSSLEAATAVLLLADRGMTPAEREWASLPGEAQRWRRVERAARRAALRPGEAERLEDRLLDDWAGRRRLDPALGWNVFLDGLGVNGGWGFAPGPYGVLGSRGRIRVIGTAP